MSKNKKLSVSKEHQEMIDREIELSKKIAKENSPENYSRPYNGLYDYTDFQLFMNISRFISKDFVSSARTLEELVAKDKKREEDGFPRRIRIGKYIKPSKDDKEQIVVVPTTTEPKLYHDSSVTEEEETTGGSGEGEEGEVIAEQQAEPQEGEGEGQGAGQGGGGNHEISSDAFDLGKVLTEKFQLPNLKIKGKKVSSKKYIYDLTDKNRGFGQVLDKKATLKKIVETNILLGRIPESLDFKGENMLINPKDEIYRILSKEKDFESQAVVFFVRDYSGSMQGKPTEVIVNLHLFIYSWLMYQYQSNVKVRFILHDTEAKEVPDFYTYYRSMVAGGTTIYPAYELVNEIVMKEQLAKENNIYIFHGTDGDDWEENGEKAIIEIKKMLQYANRFGITVAKNAWSGSETVVEKYINDSGLLKEKPSLIKLDSMSADNATETRIIEGIKKIVGT